MGTGPTIRMRRLGLSPIGANALAVTSALAAPPCITSVGPIEDVRIIDVVIPQQGGGTLTARVFAPDAALQIAPCPCLTMLPGGGAAITSVEWSAIEMARNGYVVIVTLPASAGSAASYSTAAKSGIDFLVSQANPYRDESDISQIGAAGWSLGARALSRTQEEDPRIRAIVAWDNLAISETGDAGSPACTNTPGAIRTPRVPAMGQASDTCNNGPESKKTALEHWRSNRVPAFQVVFADSTHFWWSGSNTSTQERICNYYTLAWFDRWLKDDPSATARLLSRTPAETPISSLLSSRFTSAAYFDGFACADIRQALPPTIIQQPTSASLCPAEESTLSVLVADPMTASYRWQIESAPDHSDAWTDLAPGNLVRSGQIIAHIAEERTAALRYTPIASEPATVRLRCVVTNPCGIVISDPVTISGLDPVDPACAACPPCAADFDNNGGVDGGDLAAFFAEFEAGGGCADVDLNGGIDGGDLGAFFALFEAGGC